MKNFVKFRNENTLGYPFYLNTFTLNSSVKKLLAQNEYVNIKCRIDGGYMKMKTLLGIILSEETIFLR